MKKVGKVSVKGRYFVGKRQRNVAITHKVGKRKTGHIREERTLLSVPGA